MYQSSHGCRGLNFGDFKLNRDDSFPDTFWQLTGLEKLHLTHNNFTHIPSQIGQLKSLIYLDLGRNNLVSLSDEIYQLTNLTELYLHYNELESISEDIGKLTNLTKLFVWNNQLKLLPKSIGNLVNLVNGGLWIHFNPLIKSLPDSIRKIKHALYIPDLIHGDYFKLNLMVDHVNFRVEQRVQRRLVILLAKAGPPLDEDDEAAVEKHYNQAIYQVLLNPKIARLLCEYMDWKPFPDKE